MLCYPKVLFVCSGNTCRSPMAEVLFRSKLPECEVTSAGIYADAFVPASEEARIVISELGLDLTDHKSKQLTLSLINDNDIVIVMTKNHKISTNFFSPESKHIYMLSEFSNKEEDVEDPVGSNLEKYRNCVKVMNVWLEQLVNFIKNNIKLSK